MKKDNFVNRLNKIMSLQNVKQVDLVEKTGLTKSAISQYCSGIYEPKQNALYKLAEALNVSEAWLMGYDVPMERKIYPDNILKIEKRKIPLIGKIAAGVPIFAEENLEYYIEAGTNINADFCLKVKGDSMINARINDGDIVFIKKQPDVDNGEIAAVLINDEATLKRIYKKENEVILTAENPAYTPIIYNEFKEIRILGKVIAFQSEI
jgi:repressor LexA